MADPETHKVEETEKEQQAEDSTAKDSEASKLESVIEQQNKQIETLLKQVELTSKVNQQLGVKLDETLQNLNNNQPQEPFAWVDKELAENFKYKSKLDLDDPSSIFAPADEVAHWYLRFLKEKNLDNERIATKMNNIFENITGKTGPINETI